MMRWRNRAPPQRRQVGQRLPILHAIRCSPAFPVPRVRVRLRHPGGTAPPADRALPVSDQGLKPVASFFFTGTFLSET